MFLSTHIYVSMPMPTLKTMSWCLSQQILVLLSETELVNGNVNDKAIPHYIFLCFVFSRSSSSSVNRVQHKGGGDWMFKLLSTSNIFILSYICVNANANAKANANANAKDNVMVAASTYFSYTLRNRTCQCQCQ